MRNICSEFDPTSARTTIFELGQILGLLLCMEGGGGWVGGT